VNDKVKFYSRHIHGIDLVWQPELREKIMTKNEVKKRVKDIKDSADDYESAHSMEDDLYQDVLNAIAEGAEDAAVLAKEALKTTKINFPRYCS